ncbi:MAG: PAC2 family protein [Candidatus Limnocylindrales bacterium]
MTEFDALPELVDPVLVGAFEGWNDAGDAASSAVEHLELIWDARPLAALDPDEYYDFQVNRPQVSLVDGVSRRIEWPTTRLSIARPPGSRARHRAAARASSRTCAGAASATS